MEIPMLIVWLRRFKMGRQSLGQEMCLFPVNFIASFLCAPLVATQFSVVRAPPVATLVSFFISSHHFSGHRLWRLSFLSVTDFCESSGAAIGDPFVPLYFIALHILFGDRHWRPLSFHITASFLWAPPVATQFSCLSYSEF